MNPSLGYHVDMKNDAKDATDQEDTMTITMYHGVEISEPLYGGEREFRLGRHCAYGTWDGPEDYALVHAPDQESMDAIAQALDADHDQA